MSRRKPGIALKGEEALICKACNYRYTYVPRRDGDIHCYKCGHLLGSKVGYMLFIIRNTAEVYTEKKHHRFPNGKLVP
jgi:PHP family Zn ribbon phosphoesterase